METPAKDIKALLCQINPLYKKPAQNLERIRKSLTKYSKKNELDIIMFPQMAFIGYNFKNPQDIFPFTQLQGTGQAFTFCSELATSLNTYVIYGYAERQGKVPNPSGNHEDYNLYNSACLIDRTGKMILNTRKSHLYTFDDLWSQEGDGFKCATIINTKGQEIKCAVGICMDINPYKWTSGKNELADFTAKQKAEALLLLSAWNDHQPNHPDEDKSQMSIIEYWISRLIPLLSTKVTKRPSVLILVCDRTGSEMTFDKNGQEQQMTHFIGTSCAFKLNPNTLIQKLSKKSESYLLIDSSIP